MPNYDGQYEVRVIYDTTPSGFSLMEHSLTFDVLPSNAVDPGDEFGTIVIETHKSDPVVLDASVDAFVAGMIGIYPSTTTIIRAELWFIPEGTFSGTFISVYPIDEVGTAAGGSQVAQQSTYTFRAVGGGSARLQFMESSITGSGKSSYPYGSAAQNAIPDLVTADDNFIIARDNTFLFANIHLSNGQNERLWRKRFRS